MVEIDPEAAAVVAGGGEADGAIDDDVTIPLDGKILRSGARLPQPSEVKLSERSMRLPPTTSPAAVRQSSWASRFLRLLLK